LATGKPLESKVFYFLLYVFIGIISYTSLYNFIWYNYFSDSPSDIRQMSKFISQIRFATLVDLAIFSCIFLLLEKKIKLFLALPLILWFLYYTYKSQVLNGYVLFGILLIYTIYFALKRVESKKVKWMIGISGLSLILVAVTIIFNAAKSFKGIDKPVISELELYTGKWKPVLP